MAERTRCPRCGAINYGDVKKCWQCGESFTPSATPPSGAPPPPPKPSLEETLPEKIPRIKYPVLYPIGTVILLAGVLLSIFLIYFVTESPGDLRADYSSDNAVFAAEREFPVTILGEVTAVSEEPDEFGYYRYEIDGDGVIEESVGSGSIQKTDRDLIVRSKSPDKAKVGERVIWKVDKRSNDVGQDYLVVTEEKSSTIYRAPWVVLAVVGAALIIIGYVGLPDRSMKELLEATRAPEASGPVTPPTVAPPAPPVAPATPGAPPQAPVPPSSPGGPVPAYPAQETPPTMQGEPYPQGTEVSPQAPPSQEPFPEGMETSEDTGPSDDYAEQEAEGEEGSEGEL